MHLQPFVLCYGPKAGGSFLDVFFFAPTFSFSLDLRCRSLHWLRILALSKKTNESTSSKIKEKKKCKYPLPHCANTNSHVVTSLALEASTACKVLVAWGLDHPLAVGFSGRLRWVWVNPMYPTYGREFRMDLVICV